MTTLLNQALILTLVGMGMTFAALGLLVLGMYAMTALITDEPRRKKPLPQEPQAEEALATRVADVVLHLDAAARQYKADRDLAAAGAVALALALEGDMPFPVADARYRAAAAAVVVARAGDAAPNAVLAPDAWDTHARGQQLTQQHWVGRR